LKVLSQAESAQCTRVETLDICMGIMFSFRRGRPSRSNSQIWGNSIKDGNEILSRGGRSVKREFSPFLVNLCGEANCYKWFEKTLRQSNVSTFKG